MENIKNIIKLRSKIFDLVRIFFKKRGYLEVETPLLIPHPDPSYYTEVFETSKINGKRSFLSTSPEYYMKKLIPLGFQKIFQICKAFRNPKEIGPFHNPEFTILEWYRVNASYKDLFIECEQLVNFLCQEIFTKPKKNKRLKNFIKYQNILIDLNPPWLKFSLKMLFEKYADINLDEFLDFKKAKKIAQKKDYKIEKDTTCEQIFHQIFLNEIEPKLPKSKPVILFEYPAFLAEGARLKNSNPLYAERFEFYIGGLEIGNGYSELTDWREQEKRFKQSLKTRKRKKMKIFAYDKEFIEVLKSNFPPCAGMAIGLDRLIMLFVNAKKIDEVLFFPASKIF